MPRLLHETTVHVAREGAGVYRNGAGQREGDRIRVHLGLNLRELAVVVVILGAVAAIVIFSVGGIAARGVVAACQANAKTVAIAIGEFSAETGGSSTLVTPELLTSPPRHFLSSFPSSPDYKISIDSGVVMVASPPSSAPVAFGSPSACRNAGHRPAKIPGSGG
jgi:Tfp pilus assembly protein PilE